MKIIESSDGSHTLYREDIDETYHSIHGAVQESKHIFIKNGLCEKLKETASLSILEVGFGTGLNAFITYLEILSRKSTIEYVGIEAFPVPMAIIQQLNYSNIFDEKVKEVFGDLHQTPWNEKINIAENFTLEKVEGKIEEYFTDKTFDLVYYDAFGPDAQGEMWDKEIFRKLFSMMKKDSIFVTYCAKGQVRRDLIEVGFTVERLPGPPGKREMIRARKIG